MPFLGLAFFKASSAKYFVNTVLVKPMFSIEQIFKSSSNPTYVKDAYGKIVWANLAYAQLHRSNLEQLLEKGAIDFDFSYERDLEVIAADDECKIEEFFKLEDGRGAWFLTTKKTIVQPNGQRLLLSTSAEITNLKESLQIAENSFSAKEKFLADVGKELDAPIHAVISLVKLLKKTFINKDQKRYLNSLLSISDYLLEVPKDILEYTKLESGALDFGTEVTDIVEFTQNVVRVLSLKATEQDVVIHFSEPIAKIPLVELNPAHLNLILVKFINCAIRYTKSKDIVVSVFQKERIEKVLYLQFSINNLGLDQSFDEFEDFFNSENAFTNDELDKNSRFDLGVYTCKRLIGLQGGKVWFESKMGQGTSIEFVLPFSVNDKPVSDSSSRYLQPEHLKELKLLLVDDNESCQSLVRYQIQNWNSRLDVASRGEDAVTLSSKQKYDLILMDIEMPEMDGLRATSLIRNSNGPNQNTPIVAFTGTSGNFDPVRFKEFGFTDFLKKPYHAFDLFLCISKNTGQQVKDRYSQREKFEAEEVPLYDFSGLGDMAQDAVFIRKMQKLFVDIVPGQLAKLQQAVAQKQWETVSLVAHSLKSTYGNIKVVKAAQAMRRVEEISNAKTNYHELDGLLDIISDETQKVVNVFSEELSLHA
ncbi:ATP-binding response regulator [Sabulibacter ruber]|uniref:ATP-binding response regulator n=1 Tax=Sabulibacter ruber TaxID=2811901 RepID=UPI001A9648D3|nr:response regulator [Sabulibacter ruber]